MNAIFSINPGRGQASRWLAWAVGLVAGFGLLLALGWGSNQVLATSHDIVGRNVGGGACIDPPPGAAPPPAAAAGDSTVPEKNCLDSSGTTLSNVIRWALNILTWLVGVAAVIVLMVAGFRYVVSGGSSSGVTGAKNMIVYALIGVVIVLIAQIIVVFVIGGIDDTITNTSDDTTQPDGTGTSGTPAVPENPASGEDSASGSSSWIDLDSGSSWSV